MGEKKKSRNNQTSRKERKAKKRAAEDQIPDIPTQEPALSSSVDDEEDLLDKKANTTELHVNKRKRSRADEEGADEEEDANGKNVDEEKSDEKKEKKAKQKNHRIRSQKISDEVDHNSELVKRDNDTRKEEEEKEVSVKDKEKKKEKGKKEHGTKKIPNLKHVIKNGEESSSVLDKESSAKKSKKERKPELKAAATTKPSDDDDDAHEKKSEVLVDKDDKVGTKTAGKETSNEDDTMTTTTTTTTTINTEDKKTSKTKKDKKQKKKKLQKEPGDGTPISTTDSSPSKTVVVVGKTSETLSEEKSSTNGTKSGARFIVFVGNLPYTATTASIMSHFSKLKPISVRHLTKKDDPSKSRGIAFVEFENYDTHKTALKIMHHSIFDDGQSEPRMINVELTAGGGGNTDDRKAKIKSKNERLNEQRIRRIEEEEKAKLKKEEEKAKLSKVPLSKAAESSSESNVHPSRRRMITT
ncbi:hypothetical protein EPUL_000317 [Erysiphe pulchra]|uniref:RRM domain-containing protein n=1 Tax=Erysiphe pulchra TaxID=225359 RepID=A0A2S4Q0B3_9PEZI|nr:hypothetical protein EPUL_000317 [Erysiphe pulchra]